MNVITDAQTPQMDLSKRFVRVTEVRHDGFIEFDYSVADPELFVEMILSPEGFEEFCSMNKVVVLEGDVNIELEEHEGRFRLKGVTKDMPAKPN